MQRFNVFLLIHKGLRAYMYHVSRSLQHTDFASTTEFPQSLEEMLDLLKTFDDHGHHEDEYLFSMLSVCDPTLKEEMEQEHVTDHALSTELRNLADQYRIATTATEKGKLGNSILYTFNDFIAFNLTHLNKEELVVNESLWNNYPDAEIIASNMSMVSKLTPDEMKHSAVWMMRGCNNTEIIGWLGNVKKQAPAHVFDMLLAIAANEIPAHRYEIIQNSLMEIA